MNRKLAITGLTLISLAACAHAQSGSGLLTNNAGMTVYTFDQDSGGKSTCTGQCLAIWPAVSPGDISGAGIGSVTREDGSKQATFKGRPIYLFIGDAKPGAANGDKLDDVWHVVPMTGADATGRRGAERSATGYGGYGY
ncbi:MAG: COG4315 family predicted lipoprotein [Burkholderiales bacterium]